MRLRNGVLAAVAMAFFTSSAAAQMTKHEPDAELGFQIASRLCISCHVIDDQRRADRIADIPSFKAIANEPNQSVPRLAGIMIKPHPPMVDVSLTRDEVDDVVAYILSLRSKR